MSFGEQVKEKIEAAKAWINEKPLKERYEEIFTIKLHEKHKMYYVIGVNIFFSFICLVLTGVVDDELGSGAKGIRYGICVLGFGFFACGVYAVYKEHSLAAFLYFVATLSIGIFFFIAFCMDADQLNEYQDTTPEIEIKGSWEAMVAFDFFSLWVMPFVCSYAWFFFKELESQEMFQAQKSGGGGANQVQRVENDDNDDNDAERGEAGAAGVADENNNDDDNDKEEGENNINKPEGSDADKEEGENNDADQNNADNNEEAQNNDGEENAEGEAQPKAEEEEEQ